MTEMEQRIAKLNSLDFGIICDKGIYHKVELKTE